MSRRSRTETRRRRRGGGGEGLGPDDAGGRGVTPLSRDHPSMRTATPLALELNQKVSLVKGDVASESRRKSSSLYLPLSFSLCAASLQWRATGAARGAETLPPRLSPALPRR